MMKIAYLAFVPNDAVLGVVRKIRQQTTRWAQMGNDVTVFMVGSASQSGCGSVKWSIFEYPSGNSVQRRLSAYLTFRDIAKCVRSGEFDILYVREAGWWPGLSSVIDAAPTTILELNLRLSDRTGPTASMSPLLHTLTRHTYTRCSGFVAVSNEIAATTPLNRPVVTIANGYEFPAADRVINRSTRNARFLFVTGADRPWNGLDRLAEIAKARPTWMFTVAGPTLGPRLPNISCVGPVDYDELCDLYARHSFAFSSLAMHRSYGLTEASPLKSREAIAFGLPVIGAYLDTDLEGTHLFLRLEDLNWSTPEAVRRIEIFLDTWGARKFPFDEAHQIISTASKERERLRFMASVVEDKR